MVASITQAVNRTRADEPPVVTVRNLCKKYKAGAEALRGLNLEINRGELFGLIGPDGSGKSTALKILAGIMQQTSGDASILGTDPSLARKSIGYVPQNCALYPELSVEENLNYQAGLYGISKESLGLLNDTYLKEMGLSKFKDRLASQLSGGMKQKLALCCALVSSPKLILLDEPTTGLDPLARRELWQALSNLTHSGVTAIIATPFLDEAERCGRIALLYNGKIQEEGAPEELKQSLGMRRLLFTINELDKLNEIPSLLRTLELDHVKDIYLFGDRLEVLTLEPRTSELELRDAFSAIGISLTPAQESAPSMENVFVMRLRELGYETGTAAEFPHLHKNGLLTEDSKSIANSAKPIERANWSIPYALPGPPEVTDSKVERVIVAKNLSKTFGNFPAVDNVSLDIESGEIFGLLGANGAGKTTTIKMLCGLARPTSGSVFLGGEPISRGNSKINRSIGYMSQKFTLYDDLTVRENLDFYAGIYEIPLKLRKRQIDWVIDACNLSSISKMVVGKLPFGWKQRIAFGAAVMHDPRIIFLDEPTAGVDPLARRQLWTLIRDFAGKGAAILVTTHYLDEAEFCNRLAFMAASKIVAQGTPSQIKNNHSGVLFELIASDTQKAFRALTAKLDHWRVAIFGNAVHILLDDDTRERETVTEILSSTGAEIQSFRPIIFSLEDAFIDIVQKSQRED